MLNKIVKFFELFKIKSFIKNTEIKPLGRWNINYCSKITNKKIDLSNIDHCGTCDLLITKNNNKIN